MARLVSGREWAGKVVVVTGASAGVGRATARLFARQGANVALVARDAAALEEARAEMQSVGGGAIAVPADVADAQAVFAATDEIEKQLGPIDVWVNDAMVTVFAPLSQMTAEEFRRVTEVTYLGYVYGTMAVLERMRARNRGVIVQVGSGLAYRGIPLQSAYCGAKHAIRGFTDSVRTELMYDGSAVELVMVQLPAINTPQFDWARTHMERQPRPVAPVLQPEVAAQAIVDAAANPSREVWLGASTVRTIVGNMIAPGLVDRILARRAVTGQQTSRPVLAQRRDNLEKPVRGLHRSRGSFGAEAASSATAFSGSAVRLAGLGLAVCVMTAVALAGRRALPGRFI